MGLILRLGGVYETRGDSHTPKGAVLCIEYLITASPKALAQYGGTIPDTGGYFDRAIHARLTVLDCQAVELRLTQRALDDLEITLEKRADSLA